MLQVLVDQLVIRSVHALQTQASGIQCLKAIFVDQLEIRNSDVLQKCLKTLLADQLAIRSNDEGSECLHDHDVPNVRHAVALSLEDRVHLIGEPSPRKLSAVEGLDMAHNARGAPRGPTQTKLSGWLRRRCGGSGRSRR